MKSIQECISSYESIINESIKLVSNADVLSKEKIEEATKEGKEIIDLLHENFTVKVPIVGEFSAGKSSLLNAFIDREVLPTSIRPETAVSYELYYAPVEVATLYRKGNEVSSKSLEEIKTFNVEPGDIVKVYINNAKIKELQASGITLVDMPGSDSGIEAHQKAIISYLKEGAAFITLVDIEQGSIKGSNLKFMQEIVGYNLSSSILLTKADKKPISEVEKIKGFVTEQVKRYDKKSSIVGVVSSADKDVADFEKVLVSLDATSLFKEKYRILVEEYFDQWQQWLHLEHNVVTKSKEELRANLEQLKQSAQQAKNEIEAQKKTPELGQFATEEILDKVRKALENNAIAIGSFIANNDNDAANRLIVDTVRPVMINSLQGVQKELETKINISFQDINSKLGSFVGTSDKAVNFLGTLKSQLKGFSQKVNDSKKLSSYRAITAAAGIATSFVAPWIEILIVFAPDIINAFFGKKDNTDKVKQAVDIFKAKSITEILVQLRPEIEKGIEQERQALLENVEESIQVKVAEIDMRIQADANEIELDEHQKNQKLILIEQVQKELRVLEDKM